MTLRILIIIVDRPQIMEEAEVWFQKVHVIAIYDFNACLLFVACR